MNGAEEAVAEELSPSEELSNYNSCIYLDKIMTQLLHLVFVFTPVANLVTDKFRAKMMNSRQSDNNGINSFANGMKSIAKTTNSIAKMMNSIAKTSTKLKIFQVL